MKRLLAFVGLCGAAALCFFLGHRQGQHVPLLGGSRCPGCGAALDPDYVNPDRKVGPRSGCDQRFVRRGGA